MVSEKNLFTNPGFEDGSLNGFYVYGDGIMAELTTEETHQGKFSLKLSKRQADEESPGQRVDGMHIVLGQWYEFSAYVKPSEKVWAYLIATPRVMNDRTHELAWGDSLGDQKVIEANEWSKVCASYCFTVEDGIFYMNNGWKKEPIGEKTEDGAWHILQYIDFKVATETRIEWYLVDDFCLKKTNDIPPAIYFKDMKKITNYSHAFAVLGDIQTLSDRYPDAIKQMLNWILEHKDTKNIQCVLGLGDITHWNTPREWEVVRKQFLDLGKKMPYSLVRGNHDSVKEFNKYFGIREYLSQFEGFYKDGEVTNSWFVLKTERTEYLILNLDFRPTDEVLKWAGEIIRQHPSHKVVIVTHSYLNKDGKHTDSCMEESEFDPFAMETEEGNRNDGDGIWNKLISLYDNIVLVLSGHVCNEDIVVRQRCGKKGNLVTEMLINPQDVDAKYGANGLVAMLYFREDKDEVVIEYYATVLEQYFKECNQFTISLSKTPLLKVSNVSRNGKREGNE